MEALNAYNITLAALSQERENIFEFTSMEGAAKSSRRVVLDGIIQSNSNHLSGQVKFLDKFLQNKHCSGTIFRNLAGLVTNSILFC